MLDALKNLFENNVISEDMRTEIENAWNKKIQENRSTVTQQLREEFAQKYEHDKNVMIEAIENMIQDRLTSEIDEFVNDRAQLAEAKAKYVVAIHEHSQKLNSFVAQNLAKEINELHEDQIAMANNFGKLEQFIIESLAKEITDFYNDKKDLAETKVKLVREAKTQFAQLKQKFIKESAKLVESTVKNRLSFEIKQLKEDIDQARQNDFGRKIFEAFTSEYQHSLLNEKSETSKLLKVIAEKDRVISEAKAMINKKQQLVESTQKDLARTKEIAVRKEIMNELLNPLSSEQKSIMKELLESVQTSKLRTNYDKYLPTILNNNTVTSKKSLMESTEVTGNKNSISSATSQAEVIDIRRLAGLN